MDKKYCEELAQILICPKSKKPLIYNDTLHAFINKECDVLYRIEDGIPILLEEESESLKNQSKKT